MLNVTLIAVGKLKERYLTDACAEYEKRLGAYCRLRVVEVDEYRLPQNPKRRSRRGSRPRERRFLPRSRRAAI